MSGQFNYYNPTSGGPNGSFIPAGSTQVKGSNNDLYGFYAGVSTIDGSANVALGSYALQKNAPGNYNTAIGTAALTNLNPTSTQVSLGAGSANTAVGSLAGRWDISGQCNTYLGAQSGQLPSDSRVYTQSTAIGYDTKFLPAFNNQHQIVIGGQGAQVVIPGDFYVLGSNNGGKGAQGAQGQPGQGAQGAQGQVGAQGLPGSSAGTGAQGAQGQPGQGAQGAQGQPGQGAQGAQGQPGQTGAQGQSGSAPGGNITCTTVTASGLIKASSFSATSDYRIKHHVLPIVDHDPELTVDKLNPIIYINSILNKKDMGFLAHEIQEEYPFLVTGQKNGSENQSVNYIGLIALLVKEIQELKKVLKAKSIL